MVAIDCRSTCSEANCGALPELAMLESIKPWRAAIEQFARSLVAVRKTRQDVGGGSGKSRDGSKSAATGVPGCICRGEVRSSAAPPGPLANTLEDDADKQP